MPTNLTDPNHLGVDPGVGYPHVQADEFDGTPATWAASTAYAFGAIVQPATPNDRYYRCTTAGTTGSSQPSTWSLNGTTTDNTLLWAAVASRPIPVVIIGGSYVCNCSWSRQRRGCPEHLRQLP